MKMEQSLRCRETYFYIFSKIMTSLCILQFPQIRTFITLLSSCSCPLPILALWDTNKIFKQQNFSTATIKLSNKLTLTLAQVRVNKVVPTSTVHTSHFYHVNMAAKNTVFSRTFSRWLTHEPGVSARVGSRGLIFICRWPT